MLTVLLLGLLAQLVAGATSLQNPCNKFHRRSLLQQLNEAGKPNSSGFTSDISNNGTLVQTVQIDVLQEMCIVTFNSFYKVNSEQQLNAPEQNLQETAEECCASCSTGTRCNAWQWCPDKGGCPIPGTNTSFPYLGCQLLVISAFSPYVQGFSPIQQRDPQLPFIAGAPFNMTLPQITGYSLNAGTDLGGLYDFSCAASSVAESCMVMGPAEELALLCNAEETCQAFVYFPDGVAFDGSGPVGVLKSSGNSESPVTTGDLTINPTAATYIRQDQEETGSGGTSTATIVGAVVGSVVGVALIGILVSLLVIMRRKNTRLAAAVATSNAELEKRSNESDPGLTSASGSGFGGSNDSAASSDAGGSGSKVLRRQDSPPSVIDASSGGGRSSSLGTSQRIDTWNTTVDPYILSNSVAGLGNNPLEQVVVVSEMPMERTTSSPLGGNAGGSGGGGMAPGSSARELLEAFSQMYAHRPPVDYVKLAEMLEDDEAIAAAAREEEQEKSYRESENSITAESLPASYTRFTELDGQGHDLDLVNRTAAATTATTVASLVPLAGGLRDAASAPVSQEETDAWAIQPEDVEVCRRPDGSWWQLGTGAFGTVYKGLYCGRDNVAIKVLHRLEEPRHTEAFAHEVSLLKTLRDRHIVQFLGACLNGPQGTAMLITELMELGDLWRALPARDGHGDRIFSWNRRGKRVMHDVAQGLRYLHSKRIVHFDLKSANILLSRAGTAKLADIGMARVLHKSYLSMVSSGLGTFAWSAPEVLAGRRCGCKADIYSWGVVLWEVCTGEAPVRGVMRSLDPRKDGCPVEVINLYTRCVSEDPDERPTADEILEILEKMEGR